MDARPVGSSGGESMTSRADYVQDILTALAKMEIEELRLAACLCQVIAATPEQLEAFQKQLGPSTSKEGT